MKTTHTHKGHCQRCGSIQAVANDSGLIAKHGYQVAGFGFFNGTCSGAGFLSMQVERALTDSTIKILRDMAQNDRATAELYRTGELVPKTVKGGWNSEKREYNREPFETAHIWQKRDAVSTILANLESNARHADSHARLMSDLADRVHGGELIANKELTKAAPMPVEVGLTWIDAKGTKYEVIGCGYTGAKRTVRITRANGQSFKGMLSVQSIRNDFKKAQATGVAA